MQNTNRAQIPCLSARILRARTIAVLIAIICACAASLAFMPAKAQAKSYTMPQVNITAEVGSNGSLHVSEQRVFDFNGSYTAVWWDFGTLPENATLTMNSVSMAQVTDGSETNIQLTNVNETPFSLSWRDAGGPGFNSYSVDTARNTVYLFFTAVDTRLVVNIDYTITDAVQAYRDCAELYWRYLAEEWAQDSQNVTCTIQLPVPEGATSVAGDNVRAWGHGPLSGNLAFGPENRSVIYTSPTVASGQFAEARIVFPVAWLSTLDAQALRLHGDENHLASVLDEEQRWADEANYQRIFSLVLIVLVFVISIALVLWAVVMFLRHGKEHKPTFVEKYWRDVPNPNVHPAVIARLWRWDKQDANDVVATIMHLANVGALSIGKGTYKQKKRFGDKDVQDYYITRVPAVEERLEDPIDKNAMEMLFDVIGGKRDSFWLSEIQLYGKANPDDFNTALAGWQGLVSAGVNKADYFEMKGSFLQTVFITVGLLYLISGTVAAAFIESWIILLGVIPAGIALLALSNFMTRRTQGAVDDFARSKALCQWLKDFSALDERPPTDVKVWGEFMVYAYIFGIADEVMRQLRNTMPELFTLNGSQASDMNFVPWWVWFNASDGFAAGMPSFGDAFSSTMAQTSSIAQAASSAASGGFSGGGGGGGFSGGGGGGFGGGGGGGAR